MKKISVYCYLKHITGVPNNPTDQTVIERSNQNIKDKLNKQKGIENTPRNDCIMLY